jgi:superoxide dismutase, Fe-Mn family
MGRAMSFLTRRDIIAAASAASAFAATTHLASAQTNQASAQSQTAAEPFSLPPLPYATDALEPHIDAQTMELHHDKHHAAYVNNLNAAAKEAPEFATWPVEKILTSLDEIPEKVRLTVRNNLGGHVNHTMFWQVMGPSGGEAEGAVLSAIVRDFGSLEKLQNEFNSAGARVFGSGWVFRTVSNDGKLAIESRGNQDTPLMEGKRVLFGNDVWEHSYYLKYQNRRPEYLNAWWKTINWRAVSDRYARAKQGKLVI